MTHTSEVRTGYGMSHGIAAAGASGDRGERVFGSPGATIFVSAVGKAEGARGAAAALACAGADVERPALLVDVGGRRSRPTLLSTLAAQDIEERLARQVPHLPVAARGRLCQVAVAADVEGIRAAEAAIAVYRVAGASEWAPVAVFHLPKALLGLLVGSALGPSATGVLLRGDLERDRDVVARMVGNLRRRGLAVGVAKERLAWVEERRALFGGCSAEERPRRDRPRRSPRPIDTCPFAGRREHCMYKNDRIEAIREAAGGEISPAAIRGAARTVEASTPRGVLYSTLACGEFYTAMLEASAGRPADEEEAWLILAAAGPMRARLALAWFAAELVDRGDLADVVVRRRRKGACRKACLELAEKSGDEDAWGAWLLLAWLWPSRLEATMRAHPRLCGAYRAALGRRTESRDPHRSHRRSGSGSRGRINPQIAAQFQALGLAQAG